MRNKHLTFKTFKHHGSTHNNSSTFSRHSCFPACLQQHDGSQSWNHAEVLSSYLLGATFVFEPTCKLGATKRRIMSWIFRELRDLMISNSISDACIQLGLHSRFKPWCTRCRESNPDPWIRTSVPETSLIIKYFTFIFPTLGLFKFHPCSVELLRVIF